MDTSQVCFKTNCCNKKTTTTQNELQEVAIFIAEVENEMQNGNH